MANAAILQEDGAVAALSKFATEVRVGEEQARAYLATAERSESWTFRSLREIVFEKAGGELRNTAITVALMSLDKAGEIQIDLARSTVSLPA